MSLNVAVWTPLGLLRALPVVIISVGIYFVNRQSDIAFDRQTGEDSPVGSAMASIPRGKLLGCTSETGLPRSEDGNLICKFQNMCYSNFYDTFFLHVESNFKAVGGNAPSPAVMVHTAIHLTTALKKVDKFNYVHMTSEAVEIPGHFFRNYRTGKYILFSRITGSNIAHDIHDILLPLFFTLGYDKIHDDIPTHTQICLFREFGIAGTEEIYRALSKERPVLETELKDEPKESVVCFEEVTVGLSKVSLWYQWGLSHAPEGPLSNSNVTSEKIRKFTSYVKEKLNIKPVCPQKNYGVLFSRKRNRRIVNEESLVEGLSHELNIEIVEVSLEKYKVNEIIEKLSCAKFGVGMHGAILILAMFLPKSSVLLEMFPYAINPDNHQPYKRMVRLPRMDIEYLSWRNTDRSSSVCPTERGWVFGLDHLSEEEQRVIEENTEVTARPCCNDPEWKYRMYHDTIVDVQAVTDLLKRSVKFKR